MPFGVLQRSYQIKLRLLSEIMTGPVMVMLFTTAIMPAQALGLILTCNVSTQTEHCLGVLTGQILTQAKPEMRWRLLFLLMQVLIFFGLFVPIEIPLRATLVSIFKNLTYKQVKDNLLIAASKCLTLVVIMFMPEAYNYLRTNPYFLLKAAWITALLQPL